MEITNKAKHIADMLNTLCTNPNNGEIVFAVESVKEVEAMIRRLVEELDEKNYRILELTKRYKALTWNDKQTKPLSDEEIGEIYWKLHSDDWTEEDINFARAIEERHGIK